MAPETRTAPGRSHPELGSFNEAGARWPRKPAALDERHAESVQDLQ